jgi:hypothetical protein
MASAVNGKCTRIPQNELPNGSWAASNKQNKQITLKKNITSLSFKKILRQAKKYEILFGSIFPSHGFCGQRKMYAHSTE